MQRSTSSTRFSGLSRLPALGLAGLLLLPAAGTAFAQQSPEPPPRESTRLREATIRVSGEGEASIAPDMAILTFSVVRNSQTAEVAVSDNSTAMAAVMAALKAQGIADRDLQTSNFAIQPQYRHNEPKDGVVEPPTITGYEVTNTLTVKVRDLPKLGAILDRSVKLGVNQGGQIIFTNDDPEAAMTEARKNAVEKAIAKARTLTETVGVGLGRVIEISEGAGPRPPQPMYRMAMARDSAAESVPLASGENTYSVTVNITFVLEP